MSDLETRAVWTSSPPTAPWCPDEWLPHLGAVAPALLLRADRAVDGHGASLGTAEWTLVAATRRGRLHAHRAEHGDDAHALCAIPRGWCAAVADGAGSAGWSRLGAAIVTSVVTETMRQSVGPTLRETMTHAAAVAHDALRRFAALTNLAPRMLRTTLLFAAAHAGRIGVMHVGDGALVLLAASAATGEAPSVLATSAGHAGEYSGEVQHFLPDDGALEALQASYAEYRARDVGAVLLASDGVEDPWYPMHRTAPQLVRQLVSGTAVAGAPDGVVPAMPDAPAVFDAADPAAALGDWLGFAKRGENDDRTLCAALRRSP